MTDLLLIGVFMVVMGRRSEPVNYLSMLSLGTSCRLAWIQVFRHVSDYGAKYGKKSSLIYLTVLHHLVLEYAIETGLLRTQNRLAAVQVSRH